MSAAMAVKRERSRTKSCCFVLFYRRGPSEEYTNLHVTNSVSDANIRPKRQSPTKNRKVVESSPSSEPSQLKLFEDSDDEINDFINTQLEDVH